jgi:hypothetical protein
VTKRQALSLANIKSGRGLPPTCVLTPKALVKPLFLVSDDKKDYARALKRHPLGSQVRHLIYPNPKRGPKGWKRTPEARERDRAMFPIDVLDGFTRHTVKAHARETIAFGRRSEAQLDGGAYRPEATISEPLREIQRACRPSASSSRRRSYLRIFV